MLKRAVKLFASVVLILLLPGAYAEESYRLGNGIQLGKTPLYLGGYFSLDYWHNLKGTSELELDEASVMLYGNHGAWGMMAEVEFTDAYRRRFGFNAETTSDLTPHTERVFIYYEPAEYYRVSVGKFNTPVGYWNKMPINVLRDTTSSPRIVEVIFPRYTTGLNMKYTGENSGANLLIQATPDLDSAFSAKDIYNNFDIEKQFGLGVQFHQERWSFGMNAGGYEERIEEEKWGYLYASAQYRSEQTHVMAETGYRRNEKNMRSNYGGYLQGTQLIYAQQFVVMRLEYTTEYIQNSEDSSAVIGYVYRPLFPVAVKGEYQFHSHENEDILIVSFSMLF